MKPPETFLVTRERWVASRLQAHWAAQLAAAPAASLAPPEPDSGQLALSWIAGKGLLAGAPVAAAGGMRAALRLRDLRLVVLDASEEVLDALPLEGHTLEQGLRWLDAAFEVEGLRRGEPDPPAHPLVHGARFEAPDLEALEALERWTAEAAGALAGLRSPLGAEEPVRTWPHHFDTARLLPLDSGGGEQARSLGVGMTPGDEASPEPYWYVLPWPPPPPERLAPLAVGTWNVEGWTGALLRARELERADDRGRLLGRFLDGAMSAGLQALER